MGKIQPDPIGCYQGRIGKISYYMRQSENMARKSSSTMKISNSEAAVAQRMKFGTLVKLSVLLAGAVKIGFPQRKKGLSAMNAFCSLNKGICTVEGDIVTVDYEHMLCSNGPLMEPAVTASFDTANNIITFTTESTGEMVFCNADDQTYAVVVETKQRGFKMIQLRKRGENGSTSMTLPANWEKSNVNTHVFAVSPNGKQASPSRCISLEEV